MSTLGRIEEFDGSKEQWPLYVECLEHFFTANDIRDEGKKKAAFLSIVGAGTYKVLRNIVSPAKPGDKSYADLVKALSQHFKPTPSEIVERFKFHSRVRKPGESVAAYVTELRSLTEFCNFGESLEVMIRDQLVCGINDSPIQKRLLSEPGLTYEKAVELALNAETAAQSLQELRTKQDSATAPQQTVHRTTTISASSHSSGGASAVPTCYRCGNKGHTVAKCKISKDVICHYCNKKGHLQRVCKSRNKSSYRKTNKPRNVGQVQKEEMEEETDSDLMSHLYISILWTS